MDAFNPDLVDNPPVDVPTPPNYDSHNRERGRRSRIWRRSVQHGNNTEIPPCGADMDNRENSGDTKKKTIYVPTNEVGHVIGRRGLKIRSLQSESGCRIKIAGRSRDNITGVTIYGPDAAIIQVEKKIKDLTVDCKKLPPEEKGDNLNSEPAPNNPSLMKDGDDVSKGREATEKEKLLTYHDQMRRENWANLPPIIKHFYKAELAAAMSSGRLPNYFLLEEERSMHMGLKIDRKVTLFEIINGIQSPICIRRLAETHNDSHLNVGPPIFSKLDSVAQTIIVVEDHEKKNLLLRFIKNLSDYSKVVIFCANQTFALYISAYLLHEGIQCLPLFNNKNLSAVLKSLEYENINILIVTNLVSVCLDLKVMTHLVNLDFPWNIKEYRSRIERTMKCQSCLSFITRKDQAHAKDLILLLKNTNQDVPLELCYMADRFEAEKSRT